MFAAGMDVESAAGILESLAQAGLPLTDETEGAVLMVRMFVSSNQSILEADLKNFTKDPATFVSKWERNARDSLLMQGQGKYKDRVVARLTSDLPETKAGIQAWLQRVKSEQGSSPMQLPASLASAVFDESFKKDPVDLLDWMGAMERSIRDVIRGLGSGGPASNIMDEVFDVPSRNIERLRVMPPHQQRHCH